MSSDFIHRGNSDYIDEQYRSYLSDPTSVDEDWANFFAGYEMGRTGAAPKPPAAGPPDLGARSVPASPDPSSPITRASAEPTVGVFHLIHSYRELGHLIANLDPLSDPPDSHPLLGLEQFGFSDADLDRVMDSPPFLGGDRPALSLRELISLLRKTYCSTLGVEYVHITDKIHRDWLQTHIEPSLNQPALNREERRRIYEKLAQAELFEQFLHRKFVGQKRFSIEGGEAQIPFLDTLIAELGVQGAEEIVVGMPHRGRLNVLANILGKPFEMIFAEFEGSFLPNEISGDGDVKYHLGYARDQITPRGNRMHISLLPNPSHLEAIDPVAVGIVKAKQQSRGDTAGGKVVPILLHGDAAFTGQGIVSETLALSELHDYWTGGTIHIIINNQIGFTTSPKSYRFTRYPSDMAKFIEAPIFHVNGDDPEAAIQAARLAAAFRNTFRQDVIIDIVCYRKYGHNEGDDPTFTQPGMYRTIREKSSPRQLYAERLIRDGVMDEAEIASVGERIEAILENALTRARDEKPKQEVFVFGGAWRGMGWAGDAERGVDTAVASDTLVHIAERMCESPASFHVHPKVEKLYAERAVALREGNIDWGNGERLALASLLLEGTPIRLSGQDCGRGTFSHRHAILHDNENDEYYSPLNHISDDQAQITIVDSMLSEAAVLGFEYGYSFADPRNLVIWEAQFGDFANGAQVIIDQFIVSAESKWQRMSGLVVLLPHGYEGQGPEHSSARLERWLQLSDGDNIQVCNLTTPAQYFHALRRQMHRPFRKPLIVMSPKSLLRHKLAVSEITEFSESSFQPILADPDGAAPESITRVLLCTGKIFYDLLVARRDQEREEIAIIRIEEISPFPADELSDTLGRFPKLKDIFWVQEEPRNMGAWSHVCEPIETLIGGRRRLHYAGRLPAASPAVGSLDKHRRVQAEIIEAAFRAKAPAKRRRSA